MHPPNHIFNLLIAITAKKVGQFIVFIMSGRPKGTGRGSSHTACRGRKGSVSAGQSSSPDTTLGGRAHGPFVSFLALGVLYSQGAQRRSWSGSPSLPCPPPPRCRAAHFPQQLQMRPLIPPPLQIILPLP